MSAKIQSPVWLQAQELRDSGYGWEDVRIKLKLTATEARSIVLGPAHAIPRGRTLTDRVAAMLAKGWSVSEIANAVDRTKQEVSVIRWRLRKAAEKAS